MNETGIWMKATPPWWRDAAVYQVYVRSFADSDGDGVGDLAGIRQRLDYIRGLGVSAIWLNPFYPSPQEDGGYDVSDYRGVDRRFGSLADFDALLNDAHERDLRIIIDLVPNHTSSEHVWFQSALLAPPDSPERDRYVFRAGRGPDGSAPPNDWQSTFGGPAWTRVPGDDGVPGQWYLHLFSPGQPDLNWTNEEVRGEFDSVLRFWLDRGVDGFRIDVAHGLIKERSLPDLAGRYPTSGSAAEGHPHWDRNEVHEIYQRWRKVINTYPGDRTFVAEAWLQSPQRLGRYLRPDELHTAFNFNFLLAPWSAKALREVIDETVDSLAAVGAPATWVLSNHDTVRHVTRYGGGHMGTRRARAAALLMLSLPGGAYIYQGDELGLPEVTDLPDEALHDPMFFRSGGADRGRDGCRVPIPWSGDRPPYGFGPSGRSWLPQPADWAALTAEREAADPTSMLSLYRHALRLRGVLTALHNGPLTWLTAPPEVLAFRRGPSFRCFVNLGDIGVPIPPEAFRPGQEELVSSPLPQPRLLPPDTAMWSYAAP
jgi:alpha-glucosidase